MQRRKNKKNSFTEAGQRHLQSFGVDHRISSRPARFQLTHSKYWSAESETSLSIQGAQKKQRRLTELQKLHVQVQFMAICLL